MKKLSVALLLISISFTLLSGTVHARNDNSEYKAAELKNLESYLNQELPLTLKIAYRSKMKGLYEESIATIRKSLDDLAQRILSSEMQNTAEVNRQIAQIASLENQIEVIEYKRLINEKELGRLQVEAASAKLFTCKNDGRTNELCVGDQIKVKVSRKVTSGTVRKGDNVEFVVANDVVKFGEDKVECKIKPMVLIPKGALAVGKVTEQRGRFFLWLTGKAKLTIELDEVMTVDGQPISSRFIPLDGSKCEMCIKGRIPSVNIPTTVFAGLAVAALVLVKDPTAKVVAGLTLVKETASIQSINELANGAESQLDEGLIFDAVVIQDMEIKDPQPLHKTGAK